MRFAVKSTLEYSIATEGTILLNIHPSNTGAQEVIEESFSVEPQVKVKELISDLHGNRYTRLDITEQAEIKIWYSAIVETQYELFKYDQLDDVPLSQMHLAELMYINPSRYCQSDKLYRFAENNFGHIENGFIKVLEICNWIYSNISYIGGTTNSQTSAFDTITEQAGVCRDFAHLGIALCRASAIPARYLTAYAYKLQPQDFHACFEAFLGGRWIVFDPTRLAPLNGLVKISNSRDAADSSVATIFGDVSCRDIFVSCEVLGEGFSPSAYHEDNLFGISIK